jgi:hypothetical protein
MNASELIDNRIAELGDWRGGTIKRIRQLVREAAPDIVEEWKWDTPVWSQTGNVLAAGAFQDHVKINFFHGAMLEDHHLFNAGLDAKATRAIDLFENDSLDESAFKDLVRAAVALNTAKPKAAGSSAKKAATKKATAARSSGTRKTTSTTKSSKKSAPVKRPKAKTR